MRQPSGVRGTLLAFALAGTVLLAAACGGGGNPAAGGSDAYQKALGYAQCMRSHGEPDWPDPTSTGTFSISGIDLDSPQFSAASSACQSLAPGGMTFQLSAAQQQALLDAALKFSACMRAHGITNFPDPSPSDISTSGGNIGISQSLAGSGITPADAQSPFFRSANKACLRAPRPAGGGS